MKKGLKRFLAVIMVVLMMAMYVPTAYAITKTGSLGNNVSWSYDSNTKTITVTGSGDMKNFTSNNNGQGLRASVIGTIPLQYIYSSATKVVIKEGVTNIGNYALAGLTAVKTVELPSTVKSIGNNAFDGCSALTTINLTESITSIGSNAFKNTKFANVNMPYSVKTIGDNAFSGVSGLKITCNYGDAAYNYAVKHSVSYVLRQPSVVYTASLDENAKQVKLTLKLKDASGFNAGNFTVNYNDAVTPVSDSLKADDVTDSTKLATAIVYNEKGKISIAMMASDCISYSECAGECTYTVAEFVFNINGQADKAEFTVTPDVILANDSRVTASSASASVELHKYADIVTKAATCKDTGVITHECLVCGKSTKEEIAKDPNNHTGGTEVRNAAAATCTSEGYTGDTVCLGCGVTLSKGSTTTVSDHDYESVTTPATCTEDGFVTYTCKNCGDSYVGGKIPALGHDYDESGTCTRCGDVITISISFTPGSQLTANEETAMVISKITGTASEIMSQVAAGSWTITDEKGSAVDGSSAVKTGDVIRNDATGKAYSIVILGDVNFDGKVNASDARSVLRFSAMLDPATTVQNVAADVNADGKTNASDARNILRVAAMLDPSF